MVPQRLSSPRLAASRAAPKAFENKSRELPETRPSTGGCGSGGAVGTAAEWLIGLASSMKLLVQLLVI